MKYLVLLFMVFFSQPDADPREDLLGVWWNTEKDAKVEIYPCGNKICGKIVWLERESKGEANVRDTNNSDKALQQRLLMGADVLKDFVFDGEEKWIDGTAYDPKSGKTYTSYLRLKNEMTLEIRGYIGTPILGRTVIWKKAVD
jgi:uncharacterized protein (DUF2147 family)